MLSRGICSQYYFHFNFLLLRVTEFGRIPETIDNILIEYPSASVHICSDFKEWLVNSNKTDKEGTYNRNFVVYELTLMIEEPTRVRDTRGHQEKFFDLFLTSCPLKNVSVKF